MITRRKALGVMALGGAGALAVTGAGTQNKASPVNFRFCLNTSTISGKASGVLHDIETAAQAGYDGVELWVRDVKAYLESGHSTRSLKSFLNDTGVSSENAIGFAPWLVEGNTGFIQMEEEMRMLSEIGCRRIAAPPAGVTPGKPLDLFMAGEKYGKLLELGRETGVMPQLEFWGASPVLWHMAQALMVVAVSGDADARILPDVYHMFRGGSGFETLKMLNGDLIEVFHMNDYPDTKPRLEQVDDDRVYPGDGVAPLPTILADLKNMGGEKVLSLELFNRSYWKEDPLLVAKTGLMKMKSLVKKIT